MSDGTPLSVEPTPDQVERFRALSSSERYRWLVGLLATTYGLASPEARERWRAVKQAMGGGFLAVATRFASALDRAEFEAATRCLSDECSYDTGKTTIRGARAIVSSYKANHEWATQSVDRVRYRSLVDGTAPGVALVTFEDRIEHRGRRHRYRCQQELHIGRTKLIERIVHTEIGGEREALERFFESVGIRR